VAGTTGSGKSELLRSLVASLAASVSPRHLNFVLVDYKGGSAFDACADLPHTVGLVTDLDEHLGRRALRCLEAELHYRERRVQDTGDSIDVIGGPSAASIGRSQAGRGFVRLGPGELLPFQAALSTGTTARSQVGAVEVRPFTFGAQPCERISATVDDDEGQSDLKLLVAAAGAAALNGGIAAPRRPWLEPLADCLVLDELAEYCITDEHCVADERQLVAAPIGMVDEPDHQRQQPFWWDSAHVHLLLYGVAGSGTTTALATLAVSLARSHTPAE